MRLLLRDRGQVVLQVCLLVGFPVLVVLFALDGLPQIRHAQLSLQDSIVEELLVTLQQLNQVSRVGALVSGLVMFQVVLLCLMGSNNTARELVAQRSLLEKEKLSGLAPSAIVTAHAIWALILCLLQSVWMTAFVKFICGIEGDFLKQMLALTGTTLAMSSVCLAVSAWSRTPESASLVAVYIVGFQLPLSGVILALPSWLAEWVRPFISSYWGWSAYIQSLGETSFFHLVSQASQPTPVLPYFWCVCMLAMHFVLGLFFCWLGMRKSLWP